LNAHTLYRGTHYDLAEVKNTLAKKIEVSPVGNQEIHIETDGELPGKLPAIFEILPNALKIRVPKN
jgi:diacylglycerol kinase family enzyme